MQVYDGLPILSGAATPEQQARLEHRLLGFVPVDEPFSAGAYAEHAHAEIDAALAAGRRPIVVGGTGLYLRAALADLDLRPPAAGGPRAVAERQLNGDRARRRCTPSWHGARRRPRRASRRRDGKRLVRTLELLDAGASRRPAGATRSCGRPTPATRRCSPASSMEREALAARIDARRRRDGRGGRGRGGPSAPTRWRLRHRAQGAGLRGAARGRRRGDEDAHPPLRQAPADVDAQAARRTTRSTSPAATRRTWRPSCTA